jgi:hypothetical protein
MHTRQPVLSRACLRADPSWAAPLEVEQCASVIANMLGGCHTGSRAFHLSHVAAHVGDATGRTRKKTHAPGWRLAVDTR